MARTKRILVHCCLALLAIVVGGGGIGIVRFWWSARQVETKLAALRAAGQHTSLLDLAPPAVPADRNAVTFLRQAQAEQLHALATELQANDRRTPDVEDKYESDQWKLFAPELQDSVAKAFAAHPAVLPLLERAAACEVFDLKRDYHGAAHDFNVKPEEDFDWAPDVTRTLRCWALLEASRDRADRGLAACGTLFRLAKLLDGDPIITPRSVSIFLRGVALRASNTILQSKPTTPAAREAWRKDAELEDLTQRLRDVIAGQRAWGLSWLREEPFTVRVVGLNSELNSYLDVMGTYWSDASHAPNPEATLWRGTQMTMAARPLTKQILLPAQVLLEMEVRVLAETRCLLILLAAQDAPGLAERLTPGIDDLALPAQLAVDPYSGGKLTLRKVPGGWLIYSAGRDHKDDGGQVGDEFIDVGFAPLSATRGGGETR